MPDSDYTHTGSGTNIQGNHWCTRNYGDGKNGYHYSNTDRSYYYSNPNGITYYNNGKGGSIYNPPGGGGHWNSTPPDGGKK